MEDDVDLGLDWYATESPGTGGLLRERPEDFRVSERTEFAYTTETTSPDPDRPNHAVFRAELTGYETHEFARDLSDALGVSRKRVSWAGTKDKNAVTEQVFTVADASNDEVRSVTLDGASTEPVGRSHHPVSLGDLRGNDFVVRVRDADAPENADDVAEQLGNFGGVPNLFGSQRFGSRRPITHAVGERILEDDFEAAVETYLAVSFEDEPQRTREAREQLAEALNEDDTDYGEVLADFPYYLGYERALLNALAEGKEGRGALRALPHNLRRMFVNAVQSRVFNLVLRERHEAGLRFDRAYPGDTVCFIDTGDDGDTPVPDKSRTQRVTESNVDTINRHIGRGRALVTAPLVGSDYEPPSGEPGEIERRVLESVDVSPVDFDRGDMYASEGERRPILVRPDLSYERDGDEIVFEFFLPRGSYATVVLREFLKNNCY